MEGEWKGGSEGGYYKLREEWPEEGRERDTAYFKGRD